MIKLIAVSLLFATTMSVQAKEMSVACTKHGGLVVCFSVPGRPPVLEDRQCYAAQKRVVEAENYAATHSDEPAVIARMMSQATDKLFKACSPSPVPQAANTIQPADRAPLTAPIA